MADFSTLKQTIQNYIKQNGNKEITGALLQSILLSMVTTMGDSAINDLESDVSDINSDISDINGALTASVQFTDGSMVFKNANNTVLYSISVSTFLDGIVARLDSGAMYAGYAEPSTTPAALTGQKVFYVATQAGTYTNFHFNGGNDPIVIQKDGIYFIVSGLDDEDWNAEPMLQLDDVPTASSNNAVKSGGVMKSIIQNGPAFDLSAYNAVGGVLATYANLSAALTALNALDTTFKQPGMTLKFVRSSDNKYVQYRLMADEFSTTEADWQGVNDEPAAGSENLVKSSGIKEAIDNVALDIDDIDINPLVELGKRYLNNGGYSENSKYACSQKLYCVNCNISLSDIPDGYQFYVAQYISDSEGTQIRSWSDADLTLQNQTGIFIVTFINDNVTALTSEDKAVIEQGFKIKLFRPNSLQETKVDKEIGKGLSTNDYTNGDKAKVAKIESIESDVADVENVLYGEYEHVQVTLGSRYLADGYTENNKYACSQKITVNNHTLKVTNVPEGYEFIVYKYISDSAGEGVKISYSNDDYESPALTGELIVTFIKNVGGSPAVLSTDDKTAIDTYVKIDSGIATQGLINEVNNHETRIEELEGNDTVKKYFPIKNYFNMLQQKCPNFCKKVREKTGDVTVVVSGSSLSMGNRYASTRPDATTRPPLLHTNDLASAIFDTILNQYPNQEYRRFDHEDLGYIGTWQETNDLVVGDVHIWDDNSSIKNPLTKTTTSSNASVSIVVPDDAWQFNFIYKTDTTCGNCSVSITEGNGKMEVWNGSAWVEANGYSFSMLETVASGMKGNTCYQKRLKMRCKNKNSGGINSIGTAKHLTISKGNNDSRMNVVGFEWSPREFMFTLINGSRGGWQWGYVDVSNLEKRQDSDIWPFEPDLLMLEVTAINWGASRNNYMERDPNFYVNIAKRAYFNEFEENPESIFATSHGYTDCEVLFYGDTMHFVSDYRCFNDQGEPIYYTVASAANNGKQGVTPPQTYVGSRITAYDNYNIVDEYMLSKANYIYIPVNEEFKKIAEKYYGSYFNGMTTGTGKTGTGLSTDMTHLNDNGAALWASLICPLFADF